MDMGKELSGEHQQHTYYELLGLHPSADGAAIRKSYRRLSKLYHPDTTELDREVARIKFEKSIKPMAP